MPINGIVIPDTLAKVEAPKRVTWCCASDINPLRHPLRTPRKGWQSVQSHLIRIPKFARKLSSEWVSPIWAQLSGQSLGQNFGILGALIFHT
jgi:hypothetical protein